MMVMTGTQNFRQPAPCPGGAAPPGSRGGESVQPRPRPRPLRRVCSAAAAAAAAAGVWDVVVDVVVVCTPVRGDVIILISDIPAV